MKSSHTEFSISTAATGVLPPSVLTSSNSLDFNTVVQPHAKRVAAATGLGLVDLDAEIVREAGRPIADIFASDGEAAVRRLEKGALSRIAGRGGQVVALGGGALMDGESRALAEATGRVVLLECGEEELLRRAALSRERPLLAGDAAARLRALLASRRDHYASFGRRLAF